MGVLWLAVDHPPQRCIACMQCRCERQLPPGPAAASATAQSEEEARSQASAWALTAGARPSAWAGGRAVRVGGRPSPSRPPGSGCRPGVAMVGGRDGRTGPAAATPGTPAVPCPRPVPPLCLPPHPFYPWPGPPPTLPSPRRRPPPLLHCIWQINHVVSCSVRPGWLGHSPLAVADSPWPTEVCQG